MLRNGAIGMTGESVPSRAAAVFAFVLGIVSVELLAKETASVTLINLKFVWLSNAQQDGDNGPIGQHVQIVVMKDNKFEFENVLEATVPVKPETQLSQELVLLKISTKKVMSLLYV